VGEHPLINPPGAFAEALTSWRSPSVLAPLGHAVGAGEPSGMIDGYANPVGPAAHAGTTPMPVVQRLRAGARTMAGRVVQRIGFADQSPPSTMEAAPVADTVGPDDRVAGDAPVTPPAPPPAPPPALLDPKPALSAPPVESAPAEPTLSAPVPAEPTLSAPVPTEPTLSAPVPTEPTLSTSPAEPVPAELTLSAPVPAESARGIPAHVQRAAGVPVDPGSAAPVGPAPLGPAPLGPAPLGPAPLGSAPLGSAPLGPAPLGPAPVGPAPAATARPSPVRLEPVQRTPDLLTASGIVAPIPLRLAPVVSDAPPPEVGTEATERPSDLDSLALPGQPQAVKIAEEAGTGTGTGDGGGDGTAAGVEAPLRPAPEPLRLARVVSDAPPPESRAESAEPPSDLDSLALPWQPQTVKIAEGAESWTPVTVSRSLEPPATVPQALDAPALPVAGAPVRRRLGLGAPILPETASPAIQREGDAPALWRTGAVPPTDAGGTAEPAIRPLLHAMRADTTRSGRETRDAAAGVGPAVVQRLSTVPMSGAGPGPRLLIPVDPVIVTAQREPEPAATEPPEPPAATEPPAAPEPPATPEPVRSERSVAPPAATVADIEPEELLKKIIDPLLRRLKAELRVDRDRQGLVTDLRL
jgi:hypothetical protein